jgi:hypothetical protein
MELSKKFCNVGSDTAANVASSPPIGKSVGKFPLLPPPLLGGLPHSLLAVVAAVAVPF